MSCSRSEDLSGTGEDLELKNLQETVYDIIKDIRDPEKPQTLEDLNVVYEEGVKIERMNEESYLVNVEFTPTIPHCSLASIIGLCLRTKIKRDFPEKHKVDISIKKGSHTTGDEITKQINDKERIAAAMENPNLRDLVFRCLKEEQ